MSPSPAAPVPGPSNQGAIPPHEMVAQAAAAVAAADDSDDEPLHLHHGEQSEEPLAKSPSLQSASDAGSSSLPPLSSVDSYYGFNEARRETHSDIPDVPPPAYSEHIGEINDDSNGFGTNARVSGDGRVNIRINEKSRRLSSLLAPALRDQYARVQEEAPPPPPYIPESLGGAPGQTPPPPLNVVIHVVGSRGDVQPFIALGKVLKGTYGHRVRLATHPTFKGFVEEHGLEFFSIGGDPAELMAFMVKNPGLMPGFETLRSGDVGKRRKGIAELIKGCWRSCIESGDGTGVVASDRTVEDWMNSNQNGPTAAETLSKPFIADAIIANPPSFAHIHCAEKLGIPLHVMFTMPWSPTQAFPHPLANIQTSDTDPSVANYMSYILVDMLTWQGLGDVINRFRRDSLNLEPISLVWAPGMLARLRIPYTYCWSPALIPKPKDWANHISISGFYFLSLASNYRPDPELAAFLAAGPPPVYIGFGSIVVDDPNAMTKLIFDAVKLTGQRALVSKGWGGIGADELGIPEGVLMLGNVPHDWLFKHVSCVVHHGGAGTTSAGIAAGRPTVVVPFFGDQPFWGAMVARAGAGPDPIPHKQLTAEKLAEAINYALRPESLDRAKELSQKISQEKGSDSGAQSFHQMLKVDELRCSLCPTRSAVWRIKRTQVRLSALAAVTLANEGALSFSELKLYRPREYDSDDGPWDPITGATVALTGTISSMMMGVADMPIETLKALKIHPDTAKRSKSQSGGLEGTGPSDTASVSGKDSTAGQNHPQLLISDTSSGGRSEESLPVQSPSSISGISTPTGGTSSMAQVFDSQGNPSSPGSRSRSPRGSPRSPSHHRSDSETYKTPFHQAQTVLDTGKGISRIVGAGLKSPMDFTLGLARGFHNAPRLYGEEVKPVERVTGIKSGLRVAAKEFGSGMFQGVTGLVTQPIEGAAKEGGAGFMKGVGKGIAGVTLKPAAAFWAIPGYAFKGIYAEIQKPFGSSVQNYIIAARTAQGYEEFHRMSAEERADILERWACIAKNVKRKKNPGEDQLEALRKCVEKGKGQRPQWLMSKKSKQRSTDSAPQLEEGRAEDTGRSPRILPMGRPQPSTDYRATSPQPTGNTVARTMPTDDSDDADLGAAIRASVAQGSHGNPDEDVMIERAIRASMAELQRPPASDGNVDDEEALQRAIRASLTEAQAQGMSEQEKRALEDVVSKSVLEQRRARGSDSEWDSEPDTEDDEDVKRALEESLRHGAPAAGGADVPGDAQDEELRRAIEASQREDQQREEGLKKQLTEEEIVLEYVKKQSLAEEEHRRAMLGKQGSWDAAGSSPGSGRQ
ncbi:hypothetical protein H2201_001551 [Coniosporium apollinis]|uniref:Glycosyltransferase family 28 N-terminal domain-containing protein n=1 Tax=Coniosporium apollinis TaxID=61459 RepID=A0ABQ9P2L7_9PEZI|nr:hypothetical protein H2201_001551 [Coniosporium apollinis]